MRVWILVLLTLFSVQIPLFGKDKAPKDYVPNVFIYQIPEDTADDSDEIGKNELNTNTVVKQPILTGEVQYFDHLDVVSLDKSQDAKKINLSKPQKIAVSANQAKSLPNKSLKKPYSPVKSKYRGSEESWISDYNKDFEEKIGPFSIGSNYSSGLSSLSTLEYSSGLFTKYQKNNFTLKTQYTKEQTAFSDYTADSFTLSPEYRLNKAIALKNILTTNLTTNRKTAELVLMLTPFAYKNNDRFNLELSAGQTYNENYSVMKSKFRFNTNFKL
ncbi:hypothetical protein J6S88_08005 [bacterium]|nr:hypothetical protein [bacterium]